MLGRTSGKRKRKKHRSQTRKFEAVGSFRRITAASESEIDTLLGAFFAMKEVRFQKMGIANVFGDAQVKSFFRAIFVEALKQPKPPSCSTAWRSPARYAPPLARALAATA